MALPLSYNLRNLLIRWQTTLFAILGIATVVAVLVVLMAMASGFRMALRATGRTDNAIVVQKGASSEVMSDIPRENAAAISVDPRVARGADGRCMASREIVVFINLPRKTDGEQTNVTIRGVSPEAFGVRGGIRLVEGRLFRPGFPEVIVGRPLRDRFGLAVGGKLRIRNGDWDVVGLFASEGSAFESEIWGDLETLAEPVRMTQSFQVLVLRLTDPRSLTELQRALESDPRLQVQVKQERQYYDDQAGPVAGALMGLALFVSLIMSVGAVFAAMNTMNGIVSARTRDIGTLRALGFSRRAILFSMVTESALLAAAGGLLGCLLALPANGFTTATTSGNFAELSFALRTTPLALGAGFVFAVMMGILGGLLPAVRAARLPITTALREM